MLINGFEAVYAFANAPKTRICALECADSFMAEEIEQLLTSQTDAPKIVYESFIPEQIKAQFEQGDFFSENLACCVLVRGAESIKSKADVQKLEQILRIVSTNASVVLRASHLSEAVRKVVEVHGCLLLIEQLKPWQKEPFVEKWIASRLRERKIAFDANLPKKLYEVLGADRSAILSEIEKIDLWHAENEICSWKNIADLVGGSTSSTMSQLAQAIVSGDQKLVLKHYLEIENQGIHELAQLKYLSQVILRKQKDEPSNRYVKALGSIEKRTCQVRGGEDSSSLNHLLFLCKITSLFNR